MIAILFAILSIFPVSFFFYALSERLIAKHESRVGREIVFARFVSQTWIDAWVEIKRMKSLRLWLLFFIQCSVIFLFEIDVEYLIFIYLALNGFTLVYLNLNEFSSVPRLIDSDRVEVRYSIATAVAMLCLFAAFTLTKSTSLAQAHWSWTGLFFIIPFQLAGMILFGEHPFQGMSPKPGWIQSARFYVWSMLCVKMFLGGGDYFIDLHLKSAVIYLAFRVAGIYVPNFQQRDLLRVSILYLFPITGILWLFAVVLYGVMESGAAHV
jgi:hypothetical protein